jgi:hypothetical protein
MPTNETGAEAIPMGRKMGFEMGGDEGKDIQRDTVYGNERVPPFANSRQRGRGILIKLRNLVEGEAVEDRVSSLGIVL